MPSKEERRIDTSSQLSPEQHQAAGAMLFAEHIANGGKQSKSSRFKEALCTMTIGASVKFDHSEFYCQNKEGRGCTLTQYATQLKRKARGVWKIEHTAPGMAIVLRIG